MLNDKRLWRVRVCLLVSMLLLVATRAEAGWFGDEVRSVPLDPGYSMMPRLFGDVDGDRRADYCRFVGERNAAFFSCGLAANNYAGRSFAGPVDTTVYQPDNSAFAQLADVTGDGRADLCTAKVSGDLVWVACFTNPTDSGAWRRLLVQWVSNVSGEHPMVFADANADGRADFCRFRAYSNRGPAWPVCDFYNGSYFSGRIEFGPGFDMGYSWGPRLWGDVNGDRKVDFCRAVGDHPYIFLSCATGNGSTWNHRGVNGPGPFDWGYSSLPRVLGDVTGEGRADFCRFVGPSNTPYLSCVHADLAGFGGFLTTGSIGDRGYSDMPRVIVDVTGEGRGDFCRFVGDPALPMLLCSKSYNDFLR